MNKLKVKIPYGKKDSENKRHTGISTPFREDPSYINQEKPLCK